MNVPRYELPESEALEGGGHNSPALGGHHDPRSNLKLSLRLDAPSLAAPAAAPAATALAAQFGIPQPPPPPPAHPQQPQPAADQKFIPPDQK